MFFLVLIKVRNSLDRHIIRLRRTRREDDVLRLSADKVCNVLHERETAYRNLGYLWLTFRASSTAFSASQP